MDNLIDIMTLAIFGYLTFCGISGKGKVFENENVHASKADEYARTARKFSLILGPIGLLSVLFMWVPKLFAQAPGDDSIWKTFGFICYGLSLIGVICFVVYTYRVGKGYVDKVQAKKK